MTAPLSESMLSRVGDFIVDRIGLHFPPPRWRDLQRGIELAAPELGFKSVLDCANEIAQARLTDAQLDTLAIHLTISETYFFRDTGLFNHLERVLLPALIEKRRSAGMHLRFWCAGCCTGEEAYSLAILLHRLIPDLPRWKVSLLATDINVRSLATARQGVYGPWSFRGSSAWNDTRFFLPGPGKHFTIHPELRSFVRFESLNLAREDFPSILNSTCDIDILLCRNVLMYFEPGAAVSTIARLAASLARDGWIVVAPSELPLLSRADFTSVHFDETIIHQKAAASGRDTQPAALAQSTTRPDPPTPKSMSGRARGAGRAPGILEQGEALRRAEAHYAQHRHADAHAVAEALVTACPRNAVAMRLLARICADEGRLVDALSWCDKAIAADRVEPSGYYLRAVVLRELGRHVEAGDALRQTLYLDPDSIIAHFTLGALAQAIGDTATARRHWRNTARLLAHWGPADILPESGGLSAARLTEIVGSLIEAEAAR